MTKPEGVVNALELRMGSSLPTRFPTHCAHSSRRHMCLLSHTFVWYRYNSWHSKTSEEQENFLLSSNKPTLFNLGSYCGVILLSLSFFASLSLSHAFSSKKAGSSVRWQQNTHGMWKWHIRLKTWQKVLPVRSEAVQLIKSALELDHALDWSPCN